MRCLLIFDFGYAFFSAWQRSSEVHERGVNSLKNVDFSVESPLKTIVRFITVTQIYTVFGCA